MKKYIQLRDYAKNHSVTYRTAWNRFNVSYMYHCHILEHEDAGMMGYFRVGNTGNIGN